MDKEVKNAFCTAKLFGSLIIHMSQIIWMSEVTEMTLGFRLQVVLLFVSYFSSTKSEEVTASMLVTLLDIMRTVNWLQLVSRYMYLWSLRLAE